MGHANLEATSGGSSGASVPCALMEDGPIGTTKRRKGDFYLFQHMPGPEARRPRVLGVVLPCQEQWALPGTHIYLHPECTCPRPRAIAHTWFLLIVCPCVFPLCLCLPFLFLALFPFHSLCLFLPLLSLCSSLSSLHIFLPSPHSYSA